MKSNDCSMRWQYGHLSTWATCVCVCFSASNTAFKEVLKQIESSPECGSLPMISFLILPMQRVTRLPLLMDVRNTLKHTVSLLFEIACKGGKNVLLLPSGTEVSSFSLHSCRPSVRRPLSRRMNTMQVAGRWRPSVRCDSVLSLCLLFGTN